MEIPKKYWWSVAIVVPVVIAVIGIVPQFLPKGGSGSKTDSFHINVVGTQFNGEVAFNNVTVVADYQHPVHAPIRVVASRHRAIPLGVENRVAVGVAATKG